MDSPHHIAIAEQLGYDRAWLFDTPHQSPDVWMMLALAAQRTATIGLGPGALVPTLRHPMVNASAAATLAALAPGRIAVAFGTGFAGARAMGAAPSTWAFLREYVRTFRQLLAGETVEWGGAQMQMMHPAGFAPPRPVAVPVLISALGPKGFAVARELADGLFTVNGETGFAPRFAWAALGVHGTVLRGDESLHSDRVRAAAGPGNALAYHATHEFGGDVVALPAGRVWLDAINEHPPASRHLAIYDQHLVGLNDADSTAWDAGSWQAIPQTTLTGTATDIGDRVAELAVRGITEIIYQPTGPDIPGELEAFIAAARRPDHASKVS
ncbi:LLM class flavin-dependent oxidoreductase [Mycobacterium yunnanensis]|uniref:LLM class flavin-dependent oxidoreductase n=1 Tax=Mycobacterium yunnanensis TaxID=368477 RepID=UPI0021F37C6E|nr:LLM class flavin-dependent oxidoreductase [Mycobacterium yunnanensis]